MILRPKLKPVLTLESIAFADIVINLFIFFMITFGLYATFTRFQNTGLPIELPKAIHSNHSIQSGPLKMMINRNGTIFLRSKEIDRAHLQERLNRELGVRREKTVLIQADRSISLETFVAVLDIVRSTKAKAVSIETQN